MNDQPKYTPKCCGLDAKWIEQSVNLKYFFCTKCKNEVTEQSSNSGAFVKATSELMKRLGTEPEPSRAYLPFPSHLTQGGSTTPNHPTFPFEIGDHVRVRQGFPMSGKSGVVIRVIPQTLYDVTVKMTEDGQNYAFESRELTLEA